MRGLTGSPRAEGGGGGSWAAPGTGKRRLSGAPPGERWRRVGNRGGDQGRSRHRRAPAFPTPQARPRLASPRPLGGLRPPSAPPLAGLPLGSRAPSSCRRPKTPPPGLSFQRTRAPRPHLPPAFTGARSLCFPLCRPFRPLAGPAGLPVTLPGVARFRHLRLPSGRALETRLWSVGRSVSPGH